MSARDYKIEHGLPLSKALSAPSLISARSEVSRERVGREAWKRMEAARDPQAASDARDKDSYASTSRAHSVDTTSSTGNLGKAPERQIAERHCPVCGRAFRLKGGATCRDRLCMKIARYESSPTHPEARARAALRDRGATWREIADTYSISTTAARAGYKRWQENRQDRALVTYWNEV